MTLRTLACALVVLAGCTDDGDPLRVDGDAAAGFEIPVGDALHPWLVARGYQDLPAESAPHASSGPHGRVRTFLSPGLAASLAAGNESHPRGVGAVKELYDGDDVRGWAVEVKVEESSAGGAGWYWYEVFGTAANAEPVVDGTGADGCTGCHGRGADYVRVPFPLQ
jgi:hypothetical protein